jgi:hypothetical protein
MRLLEFPLVTNFKSNDYGIQIISIKLIHYIKEDSLIEFLAQMRNGTTFIIQYEISSKQLDVKLMINTGIETFTKFLVLKHFQDESTYDILYSSNNEDELLICKIKRNIDMEGNSVYSIVKEDKIRFNTKSDDEECDEEEDKKQSGLIQVIETEESFPFILIAQENSSM